MIGLRRARGLRLGARFAVFFAFFFMRRIVLRRGTG